MQIGMLINQPANMTGPVQIISALSGPKIKSAPRKTESTTANASSLLKKGPSFH